MSNKKPNKTVVHFACMSLLTQYGYHTVIVIAVNLPMYTTHRFIYHYTVYTNVFRIINSKDQMINVLNFSLPLPLIN